MEIRVDKAAPDEMAAAERKLGSKPRGPMDMDATARASGMDLVRKRAEHKGAFLAALESGEVESEGAAADGTPKTPAAAPKAKPAPVEDDDVEDDLDLDASDDDVTLDDIDLDDEPPAKKPAAAAEVDAETSKRLASLKAAEKRQRQEIEKREAALAERERKMETERAALLAELEPLRAAKARAKYDPWGYLATAGVSEEDAEAIAKDIYSRTPAAKADPKNRDAVARMQREREQADSVTSLKKELADLRGELKAEREQASGRAFAGEFFTKSEKHASAEATPLFSMRVDKNGDAARAKLGRIASELSTHPKLQGKPMTQVVAAIHKQYEKRERARLEELGVDVDAIIKNYRDGRKADAHVTKKKTAAPAVAAPKDKPQAADKDRSAPTPTPAIAGIRGVEHRRKDFLRLMDEEDAKTA